MHLLQNPEEIGLFEVSTPSRLRNRDNRDLSPSLSLSLSVCVCVCVFGRDRERDIVTTDTYASPRGVVRENSDKKEKERMMQGKENDREVESCTEVVILIREREREMRGEEGHSD